MKFLFFYLTNKRMNQASFFIEKKALFGGYPNHNQILELKNEGVVWFIDLTNCAEKNIKVYSHLVNNWLNYPIKDCYIPENIKKFTIFLYVLQIVIESLKPGEKLYLHCRGGHGRSCLVISCFLGLVLQILPLNSIALATEYHNLRPNLKPRWLTMSPLNLKQQKFVESFFGSLYMYSNFRNVIKEELITTKTEFFKSIIILNFYLHQNSTILEILLNSGLKKIKGEGIISSILQELRSYILYSQAKKMFEFL